MPLYHLQCAGCAAETDVFRRIEERDNLPSCSCGASFQRVIQAPAVVGEIEPFISPASGRWITSRQERKADMKAHGFIDLEPGAREQIARNRRYQQEKAFEPISAAVDETITQLNVCGKLENLNA